MESTQSGCNPGAPVSHAGICGSGKKNHAYGEEARIVLEAEEYGRAAHKRTWSHILARFEGKGGDFRGVVYKGENLEKKRSSKYLGI